MSNWYEEKIDPPMRELVRLLRDNGFNTIWSCGHLPRPYVTMESYRPNEDIFLNKLLQDNDYKGYTVGYHYYGAVKKNMLDVVFSSIDDLDRIFIDKLKYENPPQGLPPELIELIEKEDYKNYQPIRGYNNPTDHKFEMYNNVLRAINFIGLKNKKVLEPGPCFGYYSFEMTLAGANVTGIEIDENRYNICRGLSSYYKIPVRFIRADFLDYDFTNDEFDCLVLINVLHHWLFNSRWLALSVLHRLSERIPIMILCMGTFLGPRISGMLQSQIPDFILDKTHYRYAKKIAEWSERSVYLFSY